MSSKLEIVAAIEAVEVEKRKIKSAKNVEEAIKLIDQDLESAKFALETEAFCPNGCGTVLVKHKFYDIFSENKQPEEPKEDLYCEKCGIRWIAEQHNPLKTEKTEKNEPNTPIEYEQVTIKVPKPIMEFLRKTDFDNEGPAAWIEWTTVESVRSYMDMEHPEDWVTLFKLGPIFRQVLGDKNYS